MEQAQLIMIWWQHNIIIQRHDMEQAQHELIVRLNVKAF